MMVKNAWQLVLQYIPFAAFIACFHFIFGVFRLQILFRAASYQNYRTGKPRALTTSLDKRKNDNQQKDQREGDQIRGGVEICIFHALVIQCLWVAPKPEAQTENTKICIGNEIKSLDTRACTNTCAHVRVAFL